MVRLARFRSADYHRIRGSSRVAMRRPAEQIRFCTSRDGVRIAYAVCGSGPPLVWLGQFVRHIELDWDSPVWRPWLSFLTRNHMLIRYDFRGCGLSDREGVEFSHQRHVEDPGDGDRCYRVEALRSIWNGRWGRQGRELCRPPSGPGKSSGALWFSGMRATCRSPHAEAVGRG